MQVILRLLVHVVDPIELDHDANVIVIGEYGIAADRARDRGRHADPSESP